MVQSTESKVRMVKICWPVDKSSVITWIMNGDRVNGKRKNPLIERVFTLVKTKFPFNIQDFGSNLDCLRHRQVESEKFSNGRFPPL